MKTIAPIRNTFRIEVAPFVGLISAEALVAEAERRFAVRDYEGLNTAGAVLISHSLPAAAGIGAYFVGLGVFNNGLGPLVIARRCFEDALRFAPEHYKQRARLSLTNLLWHEREFSGYVRKLESGETLSTDPVVKIEFQRSLAILRSLDGDHRRALARLESMYPTVMASTAKLMRVQFDYLNSLAFELNAAGRTADAKQVAAPLTTCPYKSRFPEWLATVRDIESRIAKSNLIAFPKSTALAWQEFNAIFEPNFESFKVKDIEKLTGAVERIVRGG